jgi:hypothetical protein
LSVLAALVPMITALATTAVAAEFSDSKVPRLSV